MNNVGDFQMGSDDGPLSPLNYKRAVLRSAPREFTVDVLPPTKIGGNYSYGIRVCPIARENLSISSRSSSYTEYEIWRRWEDCLDFQITLEAEYYKLSRDKVKHLKRGIHSQKKQEVDNFYRAKQAAASFESLPEGPDPREVVRDVHHLIPALTRKGSVFRVSHETVEQRGAEFAAMIKGLFNPSPHAPVLLQELRNTTPIRDFFGFWRRDHELAEKTNKNFEMSLPSRKSMLSVNTSSKTSFAGRLRHSFSVQIGSKALGDIHLMAQTPSSAPPQGTRSDRLSSDGKTSEQGPLVFTDEFLLQDRPFSAQSNDAPSHFPGKSRPQQSRTPGFGLTHSPTQLRCLSSSASYRIDTPIPEEDIIASSTSRSSARPRSNSATALGRRSLLPTHPNKAIGPAHARVPHPDVLPLSNDDPIASPFSSTDSEVSTGSSDLSSNRSSMVSTLTQETQRLSVCSDVDEDGEDGESLYEHMVDIASSFPFPPAHQRDRLFRPPPCAGIPKDTWRDSFSSIRSEASADGVLPRHLRQQFNISQSDVPHQERILEDEDDLIDCYSDYEHGAGIRFSLNTLASALENGSKCTGNRHSGSSIGSTVSSGSTLGDSLSQDTFAVMVMYKQHVITFRANANMRLTDVRERVKERFALQLSTPLRDNFLLGYMPSRPSALSNRDSIISTTDKLRLRRLQFDTDWQGAISHSNGKVTLRVLDPEPFRTYI